MDQDITDLLRSGSASLAPDEALRARPRSLMGITSAAESALATININSIFDLAASQVFAAAVALLALEQDATTAEVRLNVVASDIVEAPAGMPVREFANQPIAILRAIGEAAAPALASALEVETVRDLALWPPYHAAKAILSAAFFPEEVQGFDMDAPDDLLPKSGVYPTERIFFRKLVIDAMPEQGRDAQPIEQAEPIDLATALAAPTGFSRLATGALLTFSQSWLSQGLTLGQLLHSLSLAPGESTRIAIVDWSRRTRASASESISESELLSNTMTHSRAISEVTDATATEFQTGRSKTKAESTTEQAGGGFGLSLGFVGIGGSGGTSTNTTDVMSSSSSFGARDLAASYAQDINDRSQQNASSVRNRRASIVSEKTQTESEKESTRSVTNFNHMHALSIQYYEIVQVFRTTTQLERAERCLFVPVKLVNFSDPAIVDRWRLMLADAALTERARRQLTVEYGVVELIPQTEKIGPGSIIVNHSAGIISSTAVLARKTPSAVATPAAEGSASTDASATVTGTPTADAPSAANVDYLRAPINAPATLLALKGWDLEQLNRIGWATGRVLMQAGSDSVFVSDDALVVGLSLQDGKAARFVVRLHNGQEITPAATTETAFSFSAPVSITELESIAVQSAVPQELRTSLVLQLNLLGTVMPLNIPIVLKPVTVPRVVVKFGGVKASGELVAHLEANRLHYTQAILRGLDAATVAALLARFTYRGLPLGMLVDTQPLAVTANFLVFKLNVATAGDAEDPRWAEEQTAWRTWLQRRGLDRPAPKSEIIPLPSGGVFAEAVLGRYNAAEKLDLTRFWNWQDSPIPITAPEIAPLQAGSRAQSDQITPGQLSSPVLSIQAPTALPDPTGIAAIINAVQNGNMFRDMSGMAQTAALAQAALQASAAGATAVGEQAAQNLKTVVENQTERMRIAAQIATGGASGLAGGGGATGNRPAKNMTEEGARLNYARGLDASNTSGGSTSGGTHSSTGSAGGVTDVPSPQFERNAEVTPTSIERDLFDRQTGGVAANLVGQQVNNIAPETGGTGGGGGASPMSPFPSRFADLVRDTGKLQNAFKAALASVKADASLAGFLNVDKLPIAIAVLNLDGTRPVVGQHETEMYFSGSLLKVAAMYAAYQLRHAVNELAATVNASSADDFFNKVGTAFDPQIRNAVKLLTQNGIHHVPKYKTIFTAKEVTPGKFTVDFRRDLNDPKLDFLTHLQRMIVHSINASAGFCIQALGYNWINGVLEKGGFFRNDKNGIWLAGDYLPPPIKNDSVADEARDLGLVAGKVILIDSVNDGLVKQVTTCIDLVKMLVLLSDGELVSNVPAGSDSGNADMLRMLASASSHLKSADPSPMFSVLHSKIGIGDKKGGSCNSPIHGCVSSEASILQDASELHRFVTAWQDLNDADSRHFHVVAEIIQRTIDNYKP